MEDLEVHRFEYALITLKRLTTGNACGNRRHTSDRTINDNNPHASDSANIGFPKTVLSNHINNLSAVHKVRFAILYTYHLR